MNVNWKVKSYVFGIIDGFDLKITLNLLQKYLTGRARKKSKMINPTWFLHKKSIEKYNSQDVVFEFGAGQNLAQNIFLSDLCRRQILFDIERIIDFQLVRIAVNFLFFSKLISRHFNVINEEDLKLYGLEYYAPADANDTCLSDSSVTAVISTDTFEHVPRENLHTILTEMKRIMKPDAILSAKIDYSDHYSHTDRNIGDLNFLKFSELEWNKYNHNCHFQNRMRHNDYRDMFIEIGFEIKEEKILSYSSTDKNRLNFGQVESEDYFATSGYFVCSKSSK
jgi:hypothetical protein